jgi:hypothetical protein
MVLAPRLATAEAARLLNQAFTQEKNIGIRQQLAMGSGGLTGVAEWLEPAEAVRLLNQALRMENDVNIRQRLAESLVVVAGRLEAAEAARLLSQALAEEKHAESRRRLAVELAGVAGRLGAVKGASVCAEAARLLNNALVQEKDAYNRQPLAAALAAVAGRLQPAEAAQVCAEAAQLLNQALAKESGADSRFQLATALVTVAERLEPAEAARLLNQALRQENDGWIRGELAKGLAAVTRRLEPAEAARMCQEAAGLLDNALMQESVIRFAYGYGPPGQQEAWRRRQSLTEGLAAVAGQLEPAETARILNKALIQEKNASLRYLLAEGLGAVAGRLQPGEASRTCTEAARLLTHAFTEEPSWDLQFIAGLTALAGRLEPSEAARVYAEVAHLLKQALTQEKNVGAGAPLANALALVAERLEPTEAAGLLSQILAEEKEVNIRRPLISGLVVLAGRLEPVEGARMLNQILAKENDGIFRSQLAGGLAAVAGRLEPTETSRVCGQAAESYLRGLDHEPDSIDAEGVSWLIQPLDSERARHTAVAFTRRMIADPDRFDFEMVGRPIGGRIGPRGPDRVRFQPMGDRVFLLALERFCIRATHPQVRHRVLATVAAIGTSGMGAVWNIPFLRAAVEPFPCHLTTQDLVDLLKMPTCVGEVRRVILDQLGNRYRRRFDTHWDFVRFAQELNLNLDFTNPPQRPDPKLPLLLER